MNYHNITTDDMLNGEGLRVVLWVAGCDHHCLDCQNPSTWDPYGGIPFGYRDVQELFQKLDKSYISGITFSGGDPYHHRNKYILTTLAENVKNKFPDKTIWCYTGYLWEEISGEKLTRYIDVLVDGKFKKEFSDIQYPWAGSTNQRIIDVKKSLRCGAAFIYESK